MEPRKKWETEKVFDAIAGLTGVFLFFGLQLLLFFAREVHPVLNNPFNDRHFRRKVWLEQANRMDPDNPRGPMASHLRRTILRDQMTKEKVIEFLGEPDFSEEDST